MSFLAAKRVGGQACFGDNRFGLGARGVVEADLMAAWRGGFNGSTQHSNLFGKMECKLWPIVDGYFSQTNRSQRFGIPLGDARIACRQWMAAWGIYEFDWTRI